MFSRVMSTLHSTITTLFFLFIFLLNTFLGGFYLIQIKMVLSLRSLLQRLAVCSLQATTAANYF